MTETTTENGALVSLNLNLPAPTVVAERVNQAFHSIYGKIEEEIAAFVPDVTTEKGRQAIASLAYKIARTKTGLDEAAANVTADQKQIIDAVNAERRKMREDLDALKASVRAPLDAWEAEEARKKLNFDRLMMAINNTVADYRDQSSAIITEKIEAMKNETFSEDDYGDRVEEIIAAVDAQIEILLKIAAAARKAEAEAAELEQLRREKAEREEKERQEREAEEARKREAEEKRRQEEERERIAKEAAEKAELEAAQKIAVAEREAAEAVRRAEEAEARRIQAEKDAEAQRVYEAEQEQKRQIEAEERRQREAAAAEKAAQEREQQAAERERKRIADEKAREEEAERQRAADVEHRKKINVAAANALIKAGDITQAQAQAIVAAIFKGQIPNVTISY